MSVRGLPSDDAQRAARVEMLREEIQKAYPDSHEKILNDLSIGGCVDEALKRYLVARKWKVEDALAMVNKAVKWREQEQVSTILNREAISVKKRDLIRMHYPHGFHGKDKKGNLLWIERLGYVNIDILTKEVTVEDVIIDHVQTMEYKNRVKLREHDGSADGSKLPRSTVIIDLANFGMSSVRKSMYRLVQEIAAVDQDFYPENLNQMFIVNAPMLFTGSWKLIEVFLADDTRKKIKIIGKNYQKQLLEVIDAHTLPYFLGGTCKCNPGQQHDGCIPSSANPVNPFYSEMDDYLLKQCPPAS